MLLTYRINGVMKETKSLMANVNSKGSSKYMDSGRCCKNAENLLKIFEYWFTNVENKNVMQNLCLADPKLSDHLK